ncbi:unnamed protein product [Dicrocoelium dendriticum]|nr:unnamed protein product [Dicrocoelium dendriticum]
MANLPLIPAKSCEILGKEARFLHMLRLHATRCFLPDLVKSGKHHQLAIEFTRLIEEDPRFEIVNEVRFGLTCFRLKAGDEPTQELLNALLQERTLYLSAATLPEHICTNRGGYYLRFVSTHQASSSDVAHAAETIMSAASRVLLQCSNGTD